MDSKILISLLSVHYIMRTLNISECFVCLCMEDLPSFSYFRLWSARGVDGKCGHASFKFDASELLIMMSVNVYSNVNARVVQS